MQVDPLGSKTMWTFICIVAVLAFRARNRRNCLRAAEAEATGLVDTVTSAPGEESSTKDVSGALTWAAACTVDGSMRTWVDMEGHACVVGHRIGCDVMLWTVSLVLLRFFERSHMDWCTGRRLQSGARAPLRVLELSAGAGHLAVGLARLGAQVTATECSEEHDANAWRALNAWVPFLLRADPGGGAGPQPYQAGVRGGSVCTRLVNWGPNDGMSESAADFDVLVLSELVALGDELQALLVDTLGRLLRPGMIAYSIFVDRPFSLNFMWLLAWDESFVVERLEVDERLAIPTDEEIHLYRITRAAEQAAAPSS